MRLQIIGPGRCSRLLAEITKSNADRASILIQLIKTWMLSERLIPDLPVPTERKELENSPTTKLDSLSDGSGRPRFLRARYPISGCSPNWAHPRDGHRRQSEAPERRQRWRGPRSEWACGPDQAPRDAGRAAYRRLWSESWPACLPGRCSAKYRGGSSRVTKARFRALQA